jgi:hypothetical protein
MAKIFTLWMLDVKPTPLHTAKAYSTGELMLPLVLLKKTHA